MKRKQKPEMATDMPLISEVAAEWARPQTFWVPDQSLRPILSTPAGQGVKGPHPTPAGMGETQIS